MGSSKTDLFTNDLTQKAKLFKALAHPARLQILEFLAKSSTCISGDISDELPLQRTTVNQHLKELKEAGLIKGHTEGVKTKYCLDAQQIQELSVVLNTFIQGLNAEEYCCE